MIIPPFVALNSSADQSSSSKNSEGKIGIKKEANDPHILNNTAYWAARIEKAVLILDRICLKLF